jgi:signal transduction histidine kinase
MVALSAQTTQASSGVPGGPLAGLSVLVTAFGLARRRGAGAAGHEVLAVGRTSCDAATLALENARLQAELQATSDELRRSRARIVTAAAVERHRLERELHDGAQNRLVALQIRLGIAQEQTHGASPDVARLLSVLGEQAEAVGEELRRIARGIYPAVLATYGLADALAAEARLSGVAVRILESRVGSSAPEVELAVYLCCLEAMQNAAKHVGRDARVTVRLSRGEEQLTYSVEDDGCGFEPALAKGSGLPGMEDRIAPLGGRLDVSSTRGCGTALAGAVPWPARADTSPLRAPASGASPV